MSKLNVEKVRDLKRGNREEQKMWNEKERKVEIGKGRRKESEY